MARCYPPPPPRGVPKVLLPKGNGQDCLARRKMQAGRAMRTLIVRRGRTTG